MTACSTGAHAIGDAARLIMTSDADVMVAGGAEAAICEIGIAGFNACKALSTKRADEPEKASRPYDADRDGFVMGEGAGIVVLEEYEHAKARGAKFMPRFWAMAYQAMPITSQLRPRTERAANARCVRPLPKRGLSHLHWITLTRMAHRPWPMLSNWVRGTHDGRCRGQIDHDINKIRNGPPIGAAGAIEAIFTILAIRDQVAPPTINLDNVAVETPVDLAPNAKREREINYALSNSFGFGAQTPAYCWDASLNVACGCLKRFDAADCYVLGHGWFGHLGQGALRSARPA